MKKKIEDTQCRQYQIFAYRSPFSRASAEYSSSKSPRSDNLSSYPVRYLSKKPAIRGGVCVLFFITI